MSFWFVRLSVVAAAYTEYNWNASPAMSSAAVALTF